MQSIATLCLSMHGTVERAARDRTSAGALGAIWVSYSECWPPNNRRRVGLGEPEEEEETSDTATHVVKEVKLVEVRVHGQGLERAAALAMPARVHDQRPVGRRHVVLS